MAYTRITAAEAAENRNNSLNALKEVQSKIENILGEAEDYFDAAAVSGSAKPKQIMKKLLRHPAVLGNRLQDI